MLRMDELKTRYAQKLWERVTPENVAVTLCCAEAHNCPELKARCIDFFFSPAENFTTGAFTEGYFQIIKFFPWVFDELKQEWQAQRESNSVIYPPCPAIVTLSSNSKLRRRTSPSGGPPSSQRTSPPAATNGGLIFYPRGNGEDNGEFVSIFLNLVSDSNNVKATLEASVMNTDDVQFLSTTKKFSNKIFPHNGIRCNGWGWKRFEKPSDLESLYAKNGLVTIVCRVDVEAESLVKPIHEPPSDIGSHFGKLLGSTDRRF
jgi:hypothetical protein